MVDAHHSKPVVLQLDCIYKEVRKMGMGLGHYSDSYMYGMHGGDGWVGILWMLLMIGLLLALGFAAFRYLGTNSRSDFKDALTIAKERYAKGEISKEDLADIRKELKD